MHSQVSQKGKLHAARANSTPTATPAEPPRPVKRVGGKGVGQIQRAKMFKQKNDAQIQINSMPTITNRTARIKTVKHRSGNPHGAFRGGGGRGAEPSEDGQGRFLGGPLGFPSRGRGRANLRNKPVGNGWANGKCHGIEPPG